MWPVYLVFRARRLKASPPPPRVLSISARRRASYDLRQQAANTYLVRGAPQQPCNPDETDYPNKIGNYSKGLPHDEFGEVDLKAYNSLLSALSSGDPADFERVPLCGPAPLSNPQAGLAFDIEGADSHLLVSPPAPGVASAWRAAEAVELYWQALLRDVPFSQYDAHPVAQAAAEELSVLEGFQGPRDPRTGRVTAGTLFRGFTPGDRIGPYVSQFLYPSFSYGAARVVQRFQTTLALGDGGSEFLTYFAPWLACQNGELPVHLNRYDPVPRYLRSGRDLGEYVHVDALYEAYFNACIILSEMRAPFSPTNPYRNSKTQCGFATFGLPHVKTLLAEVSTRALKAVWYQKWFVHRTVRPEAYGGLVHQTMAGRRAYPVYPTVMGSDAVRRVFSQNGTYLLPHAFPEGCPQHPSYGQGHGAVAGACVTILKAFFDESWAMPKPVAPSDDGLSLQAYAGADAEAITVGGELNKLASNIALGRNHAAVHWRSDFESSVRLGEQVAISVLRDQRHTYNEAFGGFMFTTFDGQKAAV